MFSSLSKKLNLIFKSFKGAGKLSKTEVLEGMQYVRRSLLEADVNYRVAKKLVKSISERSLKQEILNGLAPGQQIVKIVGEEISKIMGGAIRDINFNINGITIIMLVGLQGVGKTTTAAKVALYLKNKGKKPYLASFDFHRPAALTQLEILAKSLNIDFFCHDISQNIIDTCKKLKIDANKIGCDSIVIDTAGRLHVDGKMMKEISELKEFLNPSDVLLVADSMTGQEAVNIAKTFDSFLDISGIILSKMDGDACGGAALSMNFIIKKPIKFIGTGEKTNDFEVFHPKRITSRMFGMSDVLTIIDKAKKNLNVEFANNIERKVIDNVFTLKDFKQQILNFKKIGSLKDVLKLFSGAKSFKQIKKLNFSDKDFIKIVAIIDSMTPYERKNHLSINGSRRKRIAKGSGTKVQDVNKLLKNYLQVTKMMKKLNNKKMNGFAKKILNF